MASRKTYTCFVCQKAGHEVPVFLDGKDEQGHTKYLNGDMTRHTHQGSRSSSSGSSQQLQNHGSGSTTVLSESTQLKIVAARLEYAISLLEKLMQAQAQVQEQQQQHAR